MQAAKWFDPVLGIDIHLVVVPPSPAPVPLPHPFIGVVFDPLGLAIGAAIGLVFGGGGLVLINNLPVGNTGTEVKAIPHFPMPPGVSFHPTDIPENEGTIITGSKTVTMAGSSAGRLTSIVMSCSFPISLPTSVCLAVPMGPPVLVGGPPSFDVLAAITRGIRTKWVSNKLHALFKAKPGSRLSRVICFFTGHPVDVMTGAVFTSDVDFELLGALPVRFERSYYSRDVEPGDLGPGWSHAFEAFVDAGPDELLVQLEDGRRLALPPLRPGEARHDRREGLTLSRGDEGYELLRADGRALVFRPVERAARSHPLVAVRDRNGRTTRLEHAGGRLSAIVDSAGRRVALRRDGEGRLAGAWLVEPGGERRLVAYRYDAGGGLVAALDPAGQARSYAYRGGVLVRETDRRGLSFHFEYDWEHPDGWCVRTWGDGGLYARTLTYDKHRHVTLVDDGRGGRTHYFGTPSGLVTRVIDAMGGVREYAWDPELFKKTAETDPLGGRTQWRYDARGDLVEATDALGRATRWRRDARGLATEIVDPRGGVWRHEYDERGNLIREVDPLGHAVTYTYVRGDLVECRDARGHARRYTYDAAGLVAGVDDAAGSERYVRDALGRVIERAGGPEAPLRIRRDACGRIAELSRGSGNAVRFTRDGEGDVLQLVDAEGRAWAMAWTGLGKLASRTDPLGHTVRFTRDVEENLVAVENERGEVWSFAYDLCSRVVAETGFDGRATRYELDRAGRRAAIVRASGRVVRIERDAAGRVTALRGSDDACQRFAYDETGLLVAAHTDATAVELRRDACGRVIHEATDEGWVARSYDGEGACVERRTSAGDAIELRYDAALRMTELHAQRRTRAEPGEPELLEADAWRIERAYDGDGREVSRRFPGGVEARWEYDRLGRPSARRLTWSPRGFAAEEPAQTLRSVTMTWSPEDRLTRLADGRGHALDFEYDARGALLAVVEGGQRRERGFDPAGERCDAGWRSGPGGRVELAEDERYEYDEDGNRAARHMPGGTWTYRWDSLGQLVGVTRPDGAEVSITYDALGRRVRSAVARRGEAAQVRRWAWDGHAVARVREADGRETVWYFAGYEPLAAHDGAWRGFVGDVAGAPAEAIDEQGGLVWSGTLDPMIGDFDAPADAPPWRFLGQEYDPTLELAYNRHRWFDPGVGGYISPDPTGLHGGTRSYGYPADPFGWADPLGLVRILTSGSVEVNAYPGPQAGGIEHAPLHVHVVENGAETRVLMEDYYKKGKLVGSRGEVYPGDPKMSKSMKKVVKNNLDDLASDAHKVFTTGCK